MDSTLSSLGFPRKTIGINVTQIGLDEVRSVISCAWLKFQAAFDYTIGCIWIPANYGRPSSVRCFHSGAFRCMCMIPRGADSAIALIVSATLKWRWCRSVFAILLCSFPVMIHPKHFPCQPTILSFNFYLTTWFTVPEPGRLPDTRHVGHPGASIIQLIFSFKIYDFLRAF